LTVNIFWFNRIYQN